MHSDYYLIILKLLWFISGYDLFTVLDIHSIHITFGSGLDRIGYTTYFKWKVLIQKILNRMYNSRDMHIVSHVFTAMPLILWRSIKRKYQPPPFVPLLFFFHLSFVCKFYCKTEPVISPSYIELNFLMQFASVSVHVCNFLDIHSLTFYSTKQTNSAVLAYDHQNL